jgi:hypothetical protein
MVCLVVMELLSLDGFAVEAASLECCDALHLLLPHPHALVRTSTRKK